MQGFECSPERPWGIHPPVRNDEPCGRCGWTAPGPISNALEDARDAMAEAIRLAAARGWRVQSGAIDRDPGEALAA